MKVSPREAIGWAAIAHLSAARLLSEADSFGKLVLFCLEFRREGRESLR
jgi:hypothetical protein